MKQCHLLPAATWARYDNRLKRSGADGVYGRIPVELEIRRDIRRPALPQILAEFGADALLYDRGHGWKPAFMSGRSIVAWLSSSSIGLGIEAKWSHD
jgi:hypothetical protein